MAPRAPHPPLEWLFRAFALVGLAASVALLIDYTRATPTFCGEGGGCDVVRQSAYAHPLGIPTPLFGVVFFTALLAASATARLRRALLPLALVGGAAGAGFLALQGLVIGAFCSLCVAVDTSAILTASLATVELRGRPALEGARQRGVLAALAVTMALLPVLVASEAPSAAAPPVVAPPGGALPAAVAAEQKPGVITIVEFMDFECPYCRKLHEVLGPVVASYGGKVRLVRKMVPLKGHKHAVPAALAYCCADEAGRGEAMADALVTADDLSPEGCETLAARVALDLEQYRRCVQDPRTLERVKREKDEASASGVRGLPTYWIGQTMHRGLLDEAALRASIDAEIARQKL
jgi:uncharacterized membrane protein